MKRILISIIHLIFGIRRFNDHCLRQFAAKIENKRVLELGSGKKRDGVYYYSAKHLFSETNEFVQSDINANYGHQVIDITKMEFTDEFDVILCMNVLEHVYDYQIAIQNLYRALKPNGQLAVFVPMYYPLHDEPHDYWRFTEHSLRRMFSEFSEVEIKYSGVRQFAVAYFVRLSK